MRRVLGRNYFTRDANARRRAAAHRAKIARMNRMQFNRANPSPRYVELTKLYRQMHVEGERFLNEPPERVFPGSSLPPQAPRIKRLIEKTGAQNILDYGAGKGLQYELRNVTIDGGTWETIQDYWDVDFVHCYDPSYEPFSELPTGTFDGVICTDVLEHCPEPDVAWIVDEIFAYANRFVYANVACYPARKRLPTGENAHCTIKPIDWWNAVFTAAGARHPAITWRCWITERAADGSAHESGLKGN
jgi:hypothetical protein